MAYPYSDLRDFLAELEGVGDLVRIKVPISTHLEMTEIHRRLIARGGPAAVIEHPVDEEGKAFSHPVVLNLFGTQERISRALGRQPAELRALGTELAALRQPTPPGSLRQAMEMTPLLKSALSMRHKLVRKPPCQEVILKGDQVDLSQLPIQFCWPGEPAPLITWPLIVTQGPQPGEDRTDHYNLGIYRLQVVGKNRTYMRWLKHRGGAQHYQRWGAKKREPLPAAAVIGADPATILAAVTPCPDNLSEYRFAGLLRKKPIELAECKTVPLLVSARAEIVLEGHVHLDQFGEEGPYGDHTGYYNSQELFPVFEISAITMRKDPLYLTTYTGKPPDEPSVLGEAMNELFIPLLQQQFPEIIDFYLPPEGCSYRVALVSIKKAYAGQARRVMMGVWSFLRQFLYTKWIIVVDQDIDIRDWKEVIWAVSTRCDPVRDCMLVDNTPIDYLDFASPVSGLGSKIGIDATNKMDGETTREWGQTIAMTPEVVAKIDAIWDDLFQ